MGSPEEADLTTEERAALADLEVRASQDRRLARRLTRRRRLLRRPRPAAGLAGALGAIALVVGGMALLVLSVGSIPALGPPGILMTTAGLWQLTRQVGRCCSRSQRRPA